MVVLLIGCENRTVEDESDMTKLNLLWLGDSITEAANVDADDRYTSLIAFEHSEYDFIIQGRSGWSSGSYLRNWNQRVVPKLPEHAGVVVVQLGTNDLRENGLNGAGIQQFARDMTSLLRKLRSRYPGAKLLVLAPSNFVVSEMTNPIRGAGFGDDVNVWLERAGLRLRGIAEEFDAEYISLFGALHEGQTVDGAHPTPAGHRSLADRVLTHWPL